MKIRKWLTLILISVGLFYIGTIKIAHADAPIPKKPQHTFVYQQKGHSILAKADIAAIDAINTRLGGNQKLYLVVVNKIPSGYKTYTGPLSGPKDLASQYAFDIADAWGYPNNVFDHPRGISVMVYVPKTHQVGFAPSS